MTDVVFHLGDAKTGTTSIQSVLDQGAWNCPTRSMARPGGSPALHNQVLAGTLVDKPMFKERAKRFKDMAKWVDKSRAEIVVISAERFELCDPNDLRAAVEQYMPKYAATARYISYVRPHHDRLVSNFTQRAKMGRVTGSLDDFHASMAQDNRLLYAPRFDKWQSVFGDRFTLRPFVRNLLAGQDVVQDFFEYALQGEAFSILPLPEANVAKVSVQDIAMIQLLHKKAGQRGINLSPVMKVLGWAIENTIGHYPHPGGEVINIHRSLADKMSDLYRDDAEALDLAFFDGTPFGDALAKASQKALPDEQSLNPDKCFSASERRQVEIWTDLVLAAMAYEDADWKKIINTARIANQHIPAGEA